MAATVSYKCAANLSLQLLPHGEGYSASIEPGSQAICTITNRATYLAPVKALRMRGVIVSESSMAPTSSGNDKGNVYFEPLEMEMVRAPHHEVEVCDPVNLDLIKAIARV